MRLPWKKIGSGVARGLAIGAMFDPHIAAVQALVEGVEHALPSSPGADKKKTVEAVSDALLQSELLQLTPEQEQKIRDTRSAWIDAYVAARHAETLAEQARDALVGAIAAVKG